jgi:hypothetical protein
MRTYEPIQSGPASQDRTDDAFYVLPGALDAAAARHADRFDCDDLKDVLEDHAHLILDAVKSTPTADQLMANPEWTALFGEEIHPATLRRIAEDQAERAASLFRAAAVGAIIIAAYKERIEDLAALSIN